MMHILPRCERGSIPLAMLVAIIVAGLVATSGAMMLTSQGNVRFDRNYTGALQAADTGVQQAVALANNGGDLSVCVAASTDPVCSGGSPTSGTYTWVVETDATDPNIQYVRSTGVIDGVDREVVATVRKTPRFGVAAFGDLYVKLVGSNNVSSYNSSTFDPDTDNGNVASNGNIGFNGASTSIDSVTLYNNESGNTCSHQGGTSCDDPTKVPEKLDLASDGSMAFIDSVLENCPLTSWRASTAGGTLAPAAGGYHCFERMDFDADTTISGTPANPVVIYVRGGISISTGVRVNCQACTDASLPVTAGLLIFSAGTTDTEAVSIGNQSFFAGGIYAPRAACVGNPSGAQARIFGSLICGRIGQANGGNQGGWTFRYDDALGKVGGSGVQLERWDEN